MNSRLLKTAALACVFVLAASAAATQSWVKVANNPEEGWRLLVNGEQIAVHGMVWSFVPIGDNYSWSLWDESDEYIQEMIDRDAVLLQDMGVNAIRSFAEIPPKWVTYLFQRYGIYTVINDLFGRYGLSVDGRWMGSTDYSDMRTRELILEQVQETAETYKDVPGVLFYLLGNENNYGLEWDSDAIEDLPVGQRLEVRAGYLYSLFEEGIEIVKDIDPTKPVGIVNGDIQYLNIIDALVPSLDILGVNTYRGKAAYDLFYQSIDSTLNVPVVFTELGADAFNIAEGREDQFNQADIIKEQWREIYDQSYGKGKVQNALGGFVFEWVDEWWKHGMTEGLFDHDETGTWANGAYDFDSVPGENNMNEEWFGIMAQSTVLEDGISKRIPRAAYYLLKDAWDLDQITSTPEEVALHFDALDPWAYTIRGQFDFLANREAENPVADFSGSLSVVSKGVIDDLGFASGPKQAIDWTRGEWAYFSLDLSPTPELDAAITLRVQGDVPATTFIQEGYSRFSPLEVDNSVVTDVNGDAAELTLLPRDALEIYDAEFSYRTDYFDLDGYFHNGHPDWVAEGDFFGLLPEAFDFIGMDLENSKAPIGVEFTGKERLAGITVYGGPEPYWGADPQIFAKYFWDGDVFDWSFMWNETFALENPGAAVGGYDRRASLYAGLNLMPYVRIDAGLLHAHPEKIGELYDHVDASGNVSNNQEIGWLDTFGGKIELRSMLFLYTTLRAKYVYAGVVAGANPFMSRNGSQIVDSGSGNRHELVAGADFIVGPLVISPSFLARQPVSHSLPFSEGGPRKALFDPFYVWANREAYQGELLLTWDPKGDTYFHDWNANEREHADIASSLSFLYSFYEGPTDANWFYMADGSAASFGLGLPAVSGLWSLKAKAVTNPFPDFRAVATFRAGYGQSWGEDTRIVNYDGGTLDLRWKEWFFAGDLALNEWGRADWYRNFNITYPWQWSLDIARGFILPTFLGNENRVGVKWMGQTHDSFDPDADGRSWTSEIGAYVELNW